MSGVPIYGIPAAVATLGWEVTPGTWIPTTNVDPRSCYGVGGILGGIDVGAHMLRVPFTVSGGAPVNGQMAWLAAQYDDSSTGGGKATATIPVPAAPPFEIPPIATQWQQNICPIGIVVDAANYGIDHTAVVNLTPNSHPSNNTPPVDVQFTGARLTGVGTTNYFYADGNASQMRMGPGQSLVVLWTADDELLSNEGILSNMPDAGNTGWGYGVRGQVFEYINPPNFDNIDPTGTYHNGINAQVVSIAANGLSMTSNLNGVTGSAAIAGTIPTPASGWKLRFGQWPGKNSALQGGVVAVAMINRALTANEQAAITAGFYESLPRPDALPPPAGGWPAGNRWVLPASVLSDSALLWHVNFADWDGSSSTFNSHAGPAGSSFTLTRVGSPAKTTVAENYTQDIALLWLDTATPKYSSLGFAQAGPLARISFTAPTKFDLWDTVVGVTNGNWDDKDNGGVSVMVNGTRPIGGTVPSGNNTPYPDLVSRCYMLHHLDLTGLSPPYNVELVLETGCYYGPVYNMATTISGLLTTSATTLNTSHSTSRRMGIVADGQTFGGHDIATPSGAGYSVANRMRATYPGRITADTMAAWYVKSMIDWGGGDITKHALYIAGLLNEGSPATREVLVCLGLGDWWNHLLDPGPWGTYLGQWLDALHAASPSARIWVAAAPNTPYYSTVSPNGGGHTLQEYVDMTTTVVSTRYWVNGGSRVAGDISQPNAITWGSSNNYQPTFPAGQVALAANAQAFVGY